MIELVEEPLVVIDVEHGDGHVGATGCCVQYRKGVVAQVAPGASEELKRHVKRAARQLRKIPPRGVAAIIFLRVRPVTAILVLGLLILIVGAFVIKLQSTGFTP